MTTYNMTACKHHILGLHVEGYNRQILTEFSFYKSQSARRNRKVPSQLRLMPMQTIFRHAEGKKVWSKAYSVFGSKCHDGGAPITLLHANDVMYYNN